MTTENALAVRTAPQLALNTIGELQTLSSLLAQSNYFGASPPQAFAKIMAGRELGFGPVASMVGVHIVEGKPTIGAHLLAAAVKNHPNYDYRVIRCDREACELEFLERSGDGKWEALGRVGLTMKEATDSGLALGKTGQLKANWKVHPDDMLFARCVSKGYRRYCPDITAGVLVYTPDEMGGEPALPPPQANGTAGEIVDAEFTVDPPPPPPVITAPPPPGPPMPPPPPPILTQALEQLTPPPPPSG